MKRLDRFLGLRNDVPLERFTAEDLSVALDIDLDDDGFVHGRKGNEALLAGAYRDLWSDGTNLICRKGDDIISITGDLTLNEAVTETVLRSGVRGQTISYETVGDTTFCSDGIEALRIKSGVCTTWGVPVPPPPACTPWPGDMLPGTYLLAVVAVRSDGVESGASQYTTITLGENSGVYAVLPVSEADHIDLYVSDAGGSTALFYGSYPANGASAEITSNVRNSRGIENKTCGPAPVGSYVFYFAGRMWVVRDRFLMYSKPFEHELFDYTNGFLTLPKRIRMATPVDDGIYVATADATYFFGGKDPYSMEQRLVANYGAMRGKATEVNSDVVGQENDGNGLGRDGVVGKAIMWVSPNGVCLGLNSGVMKNVTGDRHKPNTAASSVSLFRREGIAPQFLVSQFS